MVINPLVGVYIPIIRIPIKGGMTIPNIATFDHGTYEFIHLFPGKWTTQMNMSFVSQEPPTWGGGLQGNSPSG